MKKFTIIILVLIGIYWLAAHFDPIPLNHEALGLYNHMIHRIIGIVFLAVAAFLGWKWKARQQ